MRSRRTPAAALVAVLVGLLMALFASAANAETLLAHCEGEKIHGEGSSLQNKAQELWDTTGAEGFNNAAAAVLKACSGMQGSKGKPEVQYTKADSFAALEKWGVFNSGLKPGGSKDEFIATDEAPNAKQIGEINFAAGGVNSQAVVVPVLQAAIAIIYHVPAGCKSLAAEKKEVKITPAEIEKVFRGPEGKVATKWSELKAFEKIKACEVAIKRAVRTDKSGTTFQFKHFLFEINPNKLTEAGKRTWEELQTEPAANKEWPAEAEDLERPIGEGGGALAEFVEKTENTIGYVVLADGRKLGGKATEVGWFKVEHGPSEFAFPGTEKSEPELTPNTANCEGTNYEKLKSLPKVTVSDNWSFAYGGHKEAKNYPICTLTWDIGLQQYFEGGFGASEAAAQKLSTTVSDYLGFVVSSEAGAGQSLLAKHDYLKLEGKVATDAEELVKLIQ